MLNRGCRKLFCNMFQITTSQRLGVNVPMRYLSKSTQPTAIGHFAHFVGEVEQLSQVRGLKASARLEESINKYLTTSDSELFVCMARLFTCQVNQQSQQQKSGQATQELMVQDSTIKEALALAFNVPSAELEQRQKKVGDYSLLAAELFEQNQSAKATKLESLSLNDLLTRINELYQATGNGSREIRLNIIAQLLQSCTSAKEAQYLIRILTGALRIGVSAQTFIKALATVREQQDNKVHIDSVIARLQRQVFGYYLAIDGHSALEIGVPVPVMLAKAADKVSECLKLVKKCQKKQRQVSCEIKYDGERTQVHYKRDGGHLILFSRRQEIQNEKFANLTKKIQVQLDAIPDLKEAILEGEIVAYGADDSIASFQELQNRKNAAAAEVSESLTREDKVVLFDVLKWNREDLLQRDLAERREQYLLRYFSTKKTSSSNVLRVAETLVVDLSSESLDEASAAQSVAIQQIKGFLENAVQQGHEGVIVKQYRDGAHYLLNSRSQWLKLKKFVVKSELSDTLDLVPIAAYWGKGKRSGTYAAYVLAAYNTNENVFEAVCKIGTGFSDEFLQTQTKFFASKTTPKKDLRYLLNKKFKPDAWLIPLQVWEVRSDSMSLSQVYNIGFGQLGADGGISLRFPRFMRIREDKSVVQATSTEQLIDFYKQIAESRGASPQQTAPGEEDM